MLIKNMEVLDGMTAHFDQDRKIQIYPFSQ